MPHSMLLPYLHYTCNATSTVIRPAVHATTVIIDNTKLQQAGMQGIANRQGHRGLYSKVWGALEKVHVIVVS